MTNPTVGANHPLSLHFKDKFPSKSQSKTEQRINESNYEVHEGN